MRNTPLQSQESGTPERPLQSEDLQSENLPGSCQPGDLPPGRPARRKTLARAFAPTPPAAPRDQLAVGALRHAVDGWILDGEIQQHSPRTTALYRLVLGKLLWFLGERGHTICTVRELREFLSYLTTAHLSGGRWVPSGQAHTVVTDARRTRPPRPATVRTYHDRLRVFFSWCVSQDLLDVSPMQRVPAPAVPKDQVRPFTPDQVQALLSAARRTAHPNRDRAIVLFLLDTGVRASELCGLRLGDVDLTERTAGVLGKGNKRRAVPFGRATAQALWAYLREESTQARVRAAETREESAGPLFASDRGSHTGDALTRSGLQQLLERLGKAASLSSVRCSPHTFRHTFAITWLRNGGDVFTLKEILGHTDLKMTNKYLALAQADIQVKHRLFSPADGLLKKKG